MFERFFKWVASSKAKFFTCLIFAMLIGAWLQFTMMGNWVWFFEQVDRFQTLLAGSLILISVWVAYNNSQTEIFASEKRNLDSIEADKAERKLDRHIERKNAAGFAASICMNFATAMLTNAANLRNNSGVDLSVVNPTLYHIALPQFMSLHPEQKVQFLSTCEHVVGFSDYTTNFNAVKGHLRDEYLKNNPNTTRAAVHQHLASHPDLDLNTPLAFYDKKGLALNNLSQWLIHYASGGKKLTLAEAKEIFGSFDV